jgi:hypothetical protein
MPELSPPDNEPSEGELIHRWLDTQRHELQVQSERIALSEKELDHNRTLSEKTIDAQLKDRSEERKCSQSIIKQVLIFLCIIIFMLLLFGGYVIHAGKEAFLSEIIGLVIELGKYLVGAITGFFIAKSKYTGNTKNGGDE